jgi:hypothetical protein
MQGHALEGSTLNAGKTNSQKTDHKHQFKNIKE